MAVFNKNLRAYKHAGTWKEESRTNLDLWKGIYQEVIVIYILLKVFVIKKLFHYLLYYYH